MTIVDKLRKLITTKGGDPTGVMTIAEGVDRLEKTEEGGGGSSYHGFSPWPVDPQHCARVVMESTSENSCDCSVRRPITDTEEYSPCNDYEYVFYSSELPPYMRFLDSEFCRFEVVSETDEETGDQYITVSELEFTISNPNETLIALANAAREFFTEPVQNISGFIEFLHKVWIISNNPTSLHLERSLASFWVFA